MMSKQDNGLPRLLCRFSYSYAIQTSTLLKEHKLRRCAQKTGSPHLVLLPHLDEVHTPLVAGRSKARHVAHHTSS